MKCNVGKLDGTLRILLGVAIIVYGAYMKTWWGAIGVFPILTGLTGCCPAYAPFKISTKKKAD